MEIGKYITLKLEEFEKSHNYMGYLTQITDRDLQRQWKQELQEKDVNWRQINCTQDVLDLINRFDGTVSFVENHVKVGLIEDGFNMSLALYRALQGIRKMAQFADPKPWHQTTKFAVSTEEVDDIFNRLEEITKRMGSQNMRRAMQD